MAKIFISFFNGITDFNNQNAMPCFYESFLSEFQKNGNDIFYYENKLWGKDFSQAPKNFINKIKKFNPDLIILFNNCCFDLSKYFDCPIIIWEVDSPIYFSNKKKISENPNRYIFVTAQTSSQKIIQNIFGADKKNICYLPFATSIMAENIPQTNNICFIGTKFASNNIVSGFMEKIPNTLEIEKYKEIYNFIEKNPFSKEIDVINKFNINSRKIKNNLSVREIVENISAKKRIQILSEISDLGLNIYGTKSWIHNLEYNPELILSYKDKLTYSIKHNQDIYNSSKIGININHVQAKTGFSWRVCDIMASNACLVTEPKEDLKILFPNIKIPTYTNKREAYDICKKILKEDNLRNEIVLSCQEIINKKYRFNNTIKDLEQILNINLFSKKNSIIIKLILEEENIISKKNINSNNEIKKIDNKTKNIFRIKTRSILMFYSTLMLINQIPIINKILIDRDTLLDKIKKTIESEKNN